MIFPEGCNLSRGMKLTAWRVQIQFFLTVGYENAFHSDVQNNSILRQIKAQKYIEKVNFPSNRCNFAENNRFSVKTMQFLQFDQKCYALENSAHGKNFPMHNILCNNFTEILLHWFFSLGTALENFSHGQNFPILEVIWWIFHARFRKFLNLSYLL